MDMHHPGLLWRANRAIPLVTSANVSNVRSWAAKLVLMLAAMLLAGCVTGALPNPPPPIANERYAAIVVDANDGRVLYQVNADARRYPASLTKMMTVLMMFEALDAGRITKTTPVPVSENARARPPTRIGFRRGDTIDVDTAIRALVIRSANDVACAVAELLGGTEEQFGEMMTARAREIGLRNTAFRNASGLPDSDQYTTARDMALLAISLRRRFPHHYHYFSERDFNHAGREIRGHNDLLASVPGADGIKTGFIRASGYNLATSVRRGGRSVVAVVMGGESAASRNYHMQRLIEEFLPLASRGASTAASQPRALVPG
jgi:D-alanyl-D-alanine carboxypeptidase